MMKDEEKRETIAWEAKDPKPPVIHSAVHLHGGHPPCPQAQLLRQGANSGSHFQDATASVYAGLLGDPLGNPGGDEKVLPFGFGKPEPMPGQKPLDLLGAAQIDHKKPAFPLYFTREKADLQ